MPNLNSELNEQSAKKLAETEFWKDLSARDRVSFQLFTSRLCMPFSVFHQAVEVTLNRPVFSHEFATSNLENIQKEFLGEQEPPTIQEIMDIIPENKRAVFVVVASSNS